LKTGVAETKPYAAYAQSLKTLCLTTAVEQEARKWPEVLRLMTHPGVGPLTALAFVLVIGTPERFHRGKQIGSYIGLIPSEASSAGHQRLGHISKQGNALLRFLLVEAAQAAARCNPDWRRRYWHLAMRRQKNIAKVAMGRRLGVRLYWMWRNGCEYAPSFEFGSYAGQLGTGEFSFSTPSAPPSTYTFKLIRS
jgi:transposase